MSRISNFQQARAVSPPAVLKSSEWGAGLHAAQSAQRLRGTDMRRRLAEFYHRDSQSLRTFLWMKGQHPGVSIYTVLNVQLESTEIGHRQYVISCTRHAAHGRPVSRTRTHADCQRLHYRVGIWYSLLSYLY
eukprot:310937-Pleurochrysis_carterae.AAC.3